jgi:mannose-1-phosphate guanylyltransferase
MEKTKNAFVLALDAGWSDVGSWDFVWDISKKDSEGNVIEGNVVAENTRNSFLSSQNRLIAAIGLQNIVVVETNDAILIANKEQSQNVKNIVKFLKDKNIPQGVEHQKCYRPWGSYEALVRENCWQVKLIIVKSGEKLSLQRHKYRSEHWIVVSGTAKVEIDGEEKILKENESSYIPLGKKHRLSNPGKGDLKIIEVQSGSYLGEDDIERFEDNYGRIGDLK